MSRGCEDDHDQLYSLPRFKKLQITGGQYFLDDLLTLRLVSREKTLIHALLCFINHVVYDVTDKMGDTG